MADERVVSLPDVLPAPSGEPADPSAAPQPGAPAGRRMRARLARMATKQQSGNPVLEPLFRAVKANHPKADLELLERAYVTAERHHGTQMRKSGDPYITHPLAVTTILADVGMTEPTLVAALLHDTVVGMEARGFILAAPVALALGAGFVPVRKAGKLPRETLAVSYALEYGEATLEVHEDGIDQGDRVLLVDDVLATGGTADATRQLVERCGGIVHAFAVLMDLSFLHGRDAIGDVTLHSLRTV